MTSSGLKRPLDLDITQNGQKGEKVADATLASNGDIRLESADGKGDSGPFDAESPGRFSEQCATTTSNDNKRLCTTTNYQPAASANYQSLTQIHNDPPISKASTSPPASITPPSTKQEIQTMQHRTDSPISEDIDALIKDELHKSLQEDVQRIQNGTNNGTTETPILTARQTQSICEKLIKAREQKLRDEFDRKLASKLAEQYDLFAKAKYLNTLAERPSPSPTTSPVPTTAAAAAAVAAAAAAASSDQSITNAIAAAFMQRSAVRGVANSIMSTPATQANPVTATCTAQNLPNLSNLAASLAANSHNNAMPTHLTTSYMRQNAATAAAAAIRQVQMQQQQQQHQSPHQHPMQLQHPLQPSQHQLQHRNSVCSNNSTIPLGPVLLTSNLDEQLAIPEALFTLFGVFGDVIRVKILFNKKDNALIQMADANQAQVAQSYLDKQKIYGKVIRVTRSKHQLVQMPREGNQSDAGLTKDFTNSPLHRFKIPNSRNCLNIYPPSNTLHISNIPASVEEANLYKAFKEHCGFEFSSFKFFAKDRKMALMRFNSIEHATIALIKMHNFQISDEHNLRVSFSKSSM